MVTSPKRLGPEKDYAGEGQQHIQKTDPGLDIKTYLLTDRQSQCDFDFELSTTS
jgi:hypothetical protein